MSARNTAVVLGIFSALTLAGCGNSLDATVSGIVSYQGKAVPHALVNFHRQGNGPMAYAMTEEDGSFEVFTGSEKGLMVGTYHVVIESATGTELPKKYSSIDTSGLEYEIKEGHNKIDISLE